MVNGKTAYSCMMLAVDAVGKRITTVEGLAADGRLHPLQECFADLRFSAGDFIHSETAARDTLALPVYPELTTEQQRYVVASIGEFYGNEVAL